MMSSDLIIQITLALNLIICGFISSTMAINVYQSGGPVFDRWDTSWPLALPACGALCSLAGLYKNRWASYLSYIFAGSLYTIFAFGLLDWYFDPIEQGRNGGLMPIIIICFLIFTLNFVGLICLYKNKQ